MKCFIIPVIIVISLLAFFVIIDYKEFTRQSNRQEIQTNAIRTTKSVSQGEIGRIKSEEKTGETTEQAERINIESTPVAKTNPVIETIPRAPAAIPAATPEEAETFNREAIEYAIAKKEKVEPFYNLYQNSHLETVVLEGTIRTVSTIPNPETNDYDNCLYALFVEIDSLLSDLTDNATISYEIILNAPIMKDKTIFQNNVFYPGDKIWCTCAEYDTMPQPIQEIQLSDDIQSFEHQQYYATKINKISSFSETGNKTFAKREISILPIQSFPKDETVSALRKERILSEIARVENEIKNHGGSFQSWKEEYKTIAKRYDQLISEEYNVWINDSYYSAVMRETNYDSESFIKEILPYKKYLEDNNIDLILLRMPTKGDFAARVLGADDYQENPAWVECYYNFLKNDIEVVDPMHEMWIHRFDYPLFYFYHMPRENHPLEGTTFTASKVLSGVLKRYSYKKQSPISLIDVTSERNDPRFFWPSGNPKYDSKKHITYHGVIQDDKFVKTSVNSGSPFLFTSNSFFDYPDRSSGATVLGYTSYFLQTIPDWLYQSGVGCGPMLKNLVSNSNLLSGRQVVVMDVIGGPTRNDSFPSLPKYLLDGANKICLEKTINTLTDETDGIEIKAQPNVLINKTDDGKTSIKSNSESASIFSFSMEIQPVPGKSTCMLRLNFSNTIAGSFTIVDLKDNSKLDFGEIANGQNLFVDFFIKTSADSTPRKIDVKCNFSGPREIILRNIELWYY